MKDWLPLFQSLIWPLIFVVLLVVARKHVFSILNTLAKRLAGGDSFKAGPFSLERSIPQDAYSPNPPEDDSPKSASTPEMPAEVQRIREVRLIHQVGPWGRDDDDYTRRDVAVWLETYPKSVAKTIANVTYYLPDSWPKRLRVQVKDSPDDGFRLKTRAYGEVTVGAKICFNNGNPPIIINRYCNFYDRNGDQ